jgi:uncharacterized protein YjeT (DUF2065 family)
VPTGTRQVKGTQDRMDDQVRIGGYALLCAGVILTLAALFAGPLGLVEFRSPMPGGQVLLEAIGVVMIIAGFIVLRRHR